MQSYDTRDRILQLQTLVAQQLAEEVVAARGFGRTLAKCVCAECYAALRVSDLMS